MLFALRQGAQRGLQRAKRTARSLRAVAEGLRWIGNPPTPKDPQPYHVLLRLDGIGDFWLWLPFVEALRQAYPDRSFLLVANTLWADLAQATGLFWRVLPLQPFLLRRDRRYRKEALTLLMQHLPAAEKLWQTTYSRRIAVEDLVAWAIPAAERIVWSRDPTAGEPLWLGNRLDRRLYSTVYPSSLPPLAHEWIRYSEWLIRLKLGTLPLSLYAYLAEKFREGRNGSIYIVFIAGAQAVYRRPPVDFTARLLSQLHQRLQIPIYLLGSEADRPYTTQIAEQLPPFAYKNLTGTLSLPQAVEKISGAFLVVGPETGLAHIAATSGVPTLVLAGGGHWGRFIPYSRGAPINLKVLTHTLPCFGCGWYCGYQLSQTKPVPCLPHTHPEESIEAALTWVDSLLSQPTSRA